MIRGERNRSIQDWITQQWVRYFGERLYLDKDSWLLGPFGKVGARGPDFLSQLASGEHLKIDKQKGGIIEHFDELGFTEEEQNRLHPQVIDFYQNTSAYDLQFRVKWNPLFKFCGLLLRFLFSKRIGQLNIPIRNIAADEAMSSEVIALIDKNTGAKRYTLWLRALIGSGELVYSGVYDLAKLPNGKRCVKAVFPLPNGNATVLLVPKISPDGALILESSGNKKGDAGFYFLLVDKQGDLWTKYLSSFRDSLSVFSDKNGLQAVQRLTLWKLFVVEFRYRIFLKRS